MRCPLQLFHTRAEFATLANSAKVRSALRDKFRTKPYEADLYERIVGQAIYAVSSNYPVKSVKNTDAEADTEKHLDQIQVCSVLLL